MLNLLVDYFIVFRVAICFILVNYIMLSTSFNNSIIFRLDIMVYSCFINRLLLIHFIVIMLYTCFISSFSNYIIFILIDYFMLSTFFPNSTFVILGISFINGTIFRLDSRFVPFDMGDTSLSCIFDI
jgi:hypothetical protein